jgi:hypothetical protein
MSIPQLTKPQIATLKTRFQEISNSMTRMEAERDNIREIVNLCATEFELNKRLTRKAARAFHKHNIEEENALQNEVNELHTIIT